MEIAPLTVSFAKTATSGSNYRCENLLKKHFKEMSKKKNITCDYICSKCVKTPGGKYDFENSLKRMEDYANSGNLEAGASMHAKSSCRHIVANDVSSFSCG